ncbi:hypothetical protein HUO09_17550 [Vibrio sp. Y2-5]|uniref:hypothetical protein n=1 Tax=Vibrio sp. Y2-5 TaxID=2743977 RepID=UPI001660D88D|nr:hypothetical protein [Vibrio sp. Y2-5]MBD0788163.1 hypothetical protein [Vibrio sp. Y2-5]
MNTPAQTVLENQSEKTNKNLHLSLRLEIILSGNDFDGDLNFGAVELIDQKNYLLDSLDTRGNPVMMDGREVYRLETTFETYENTIDTFSDYDKGVYDFHQSLMEVLKKMPMARVNLHTEFRSDAEYNNINRVISMRLFDTESDLSIPVVHDIDF